MKIFVCYHKKYPLCTSDVLSPIHVGKARAKTNLSIIGDDTGDNISLKNPYYCELTATYWIWKNFKDDIVGLSHYRRYFNLKNDHTKIDKIKLDFADWSGNNQKTIRPLLKQYDIILPKQEIISKNNTLYTYYTNKHFKQDLDMMLDIIKEKYPHQYKTAYKTLHINSKGYYANMILTRKDIFDNYAQWLFDILFELEKRIQKDIEKRNKYQQRVYGFLSERLMTVWVALHPELKVKELPIIFVEENKRKWYKYLLIYWITKFLNIFRKEKHG